MRAMNKLFSKFRDCNRWSYFYKTLYLNTFTHAVRSFLFKITTIHFHNFLISVIRKLKQYAIINRKHNLLLLYNFMALYAPNLATYIIFYTYLYRKIVWRRNQLRLCYILKNTPSFLPFMIILPRIPFWQRWFDKFD